MCESEQRLKDWVKSNWRCDHTYGDGHSCIKHGRCGKCGCVADNFQFSVGRFSHIGSACHGTIFEHDGSLIWYKDALYELGLLELEKPQWRPVEGMNVSH